MTFTLLGGSREREKWPTIFRYPSTDSRGGHSPVSSVTKWLDQSRFDVTSSYKSVAPSPTFTSIAKQHNVLWSSPEGADETAFNVVRVAFSETGYMLNVVRRPALRSLASLLSFLVCCLVFFLLYSSSYGKKNG